MEADNGDDAENIILEEQPDIVLLDWMLPGKPGSQVCNNIREKGYDKLIIMMTAKAQDVDKIEAYNFGVSDYITKPFSMEELLVRVNAVLRRSNKQRAQNSDDVKFSIGKYQFDAEKQTLVHGKEEQKLTTKESQLLRLLCVHKNDVLDRNFALKTIWHDDNYFNGRSMDVYIAKLRKYLGGDEGVSLLNVHGKGFKLLSK